MFQRVLAIISYLVRFYSDRLTENEFEESVVDNLLNEGFKLEEINTAFELILREPERIENTDQKPDLTRPCWIFSNIFENKITPDLRAELLRLYYASYLSVEEMADLVHACLYLKKEEVDLSDLPFLVSGVIKDPLRKWILLLPVHGEKGESLLFKH